MNTQTTCNECTATYVFGSSSVSLTLCPLHKAAPALYEALEALATRAAIMSSAIDYDRQLKPDQAAQLKLASEDLALVMLDARAALAQVKGEA